ncbi:GyrI-like domain-containing protein [Aeromicrobium wangtongii]|uniref:GyrI-like domain-containing protein n=1 Tax=Aeromicrobium wangtongii TaxID=2969247 RepID=A0ABY5MCN1_9ACTN|nr:GyrI-like domain-containing protein [Aeromicrobium wangtongii]MCD9197188.1 GyrI-like domain-containing protein [Aeromicrobium wangtongii]UUP14684.1 GyrI-like domain-containing protein [Aeromicrobium wangtongii]
MADKTDFKKTLASYRAPRGRFEIVDVPALTYLMVDGRGDPNTSPTFEEAVQALYPVAYGLKMTSKRELGRDYVVPPLEALWWADDMAAFTTARDKSRWSWTLLLMVPDWIGADLFAAAVRRAAAKDGRSARLDDIRWETLAEGRCVQTLHIGSFEDETPVLARMHEEFIPAHGLRMTGRHHEIYLSDFRRTEPARLRTILRQPVVDAA